MILEKLSQQKLRPIYSQLENFATLHKFDYDSRAKIKRQIRLGVVTVLLISLIKPLPCHAAIYEYSFFYGFKFEAQNEKEKNLYDNYINRSIILVLNSGHSIGIYR